ncbi:MAG: hypothetical protein J5585_06590 [Clostridia bacterium]|nr:hypothetical protein [Clostridia bacterium]
MKKTIIAILLIITAVILFGCVSARKPVVLFAGNFGAEDNSKKTAFLNENNGNFFDDRPMTIMHFFNGKTVTLEYKGSSYNIGTVSEYIHNYYYYSAEDKTTIFISVDDDNNVLDYVEHYYDNIRTQPDTDRITEKTAIEIARGFITKNLGLSVDDYAAECTATGNSITVKYHKAQYKDVVEIKDSVFVTVDAFDGRVFEYHTSTFRQIDLNEIPDINFQSVSRSIADLMSTNIKKLNNSQFADYKSLYITNDSYMICKTYDGKYVLQCQTYIRDKALSEKNEFSDDIYTVLCYVPLD